MLGFLGGAESGVTVGDGLVGGVDSVGGVEGGGDAGLASEDGGGVVALG
jgi:hypothetical protein